MAVPSAVYSAPGKALLAGGYLVLFPEYSALSIGLESRMHTAVFPCSEASTSSQDSSTLEILSPQFDSQWEYPSKLGTHPNPFLDACYDTVSAYFQTPPKGRIVVWSDKGFHSQVGSKQNYFPGGLSQFSYHGKPITEVAKTGLGSSAALVVAVVAAMVKLVNNNTDYDPTSVHNLSQIAHCMAQRKVGSGFDVATAVFGSIIYSRFAASEIPTVLSPESVREAVNKKWKLTTTPCALPANLQIVMGDVAQGSETPGMVRKVLQWRESNPEQSEALFKDLNRANMTLAAVLKEGTASQQISDAIKDVRANLQKLTQLSGVPIEPNSQTDLLDAASQVNGVLGGVVPGAGGDDAVCLVVDTSQAPIEEILHGLQHIDVADVSWMLLPTAKIGLRPESTSAYAYHF